MYIQINKKITTKKVLQNILSKKKKKGSSKYVCQMQYVLLLFE